MVFIARWTFIFFVVFAQLLSGVPLFAPPHGRQHTRLPCPSPSPGACSDSCPLSWWCHPTISPSDFFIDPGIQKTVLNRALTNMLHFHENSNRIRWFGEDYFWKEKQYTLTTKVRCWNMILRGILSLLYSLVFKNVQFILLRVQCQNRHMEPLAIAICLEFFFFFFWFLWKEGWIRLSLDVSLRYFSEENAGVRGRKVKVIWVVIQQLQSNVGDGERTGRGPALGTGESGRPVRTARWGRKRHVGQDV